MARQELGADATNLSEKQPIRPVCDLLTQAAKDAGVADFSKYRLGKAFLRWLRANGWADLQHNEREAIGPLFQAVNKATR